MSHRARVIRTSVAGWIIVAAGGFHSLYYITGMLGGWEKDGWNTLQAVVGVITALLGVWVLAWRNKKFNGRSLLLLRLAQCAAGLFLLVFLTVEALIWNAGRSGALKDTDYLLILGARVRGETVTLSLRDRLEQGLDYLKQYPDTPVILSGGQGIGEDIAEAEAMKRYLTERGIDSSRIILEDRSTSTYENLTLTRELLKSQGVDIGAVTFTLVTNDFHMYRSKFLARRAGLTVHGLPASTPPYTLAKSYTREFAALFKSIVIDR